MWWTSKELRLSLIQLKDKTFTFTGAGETFTKSNARRYKKLIRPLVHAWRDQLQTYPRWQQVIWASQSDVAVGG